MRITTELNIPIEVNILNKPVFKDEIQIGKITDSYIKNGRLVVIITFNKKLKQFKNLLITLKELQK